MTWSQVRLPVVHGSAWESHRPASSVRRRKQAAARTDGGRRHQAVRRRHCQIPGAAPAACSARSPARFRIRRRPQLNQRQRRAGGGDSASAAQGAGRAISSCAPVTAVVKRRVDDAVRTDEPGGRAGERLTMKSAGRVRRRRFTCAFPRRRRWRPCRRRCSPCCRRCRRSSNTASSAATSCCAMSTRR